MNMPESEQHGDDEQLVTLLTATSEFAANAIVVVLEDAGIPARAFGSVQGGLGWANFGFCSTPVQVQQKDLEQARRVLDQAKQDSIDIDWDNVDVGTREDNLPLSTGQPPIMFKVCMFAAIAVFLVVAVGFIVMQFVD